VLSGTIEILASPRHELCGPMPRSLSLLGSQVVWDLATANTLTDFGTYSISVLINDTG